MTAAEQFWAQRANLAGKRALIAGGGGGLGKACALDLAGGRAPRALCDREAAALERTAGQLRDETGADVLTAVLDVRDADALGAFYAQADAGFDGALDVVVNVAGGTWFQSFADSAPKGWDTLIRTNYTWILHSMHLAIPRLRAAGGGSIVNITSTDAHRGVPGVAIYASMKAAVTHMGRSLAIELGPEKIRVNTIATVDVVTEAMASIGDRSAPDAPSPAKAEVTRTRLGRPASLEDVGSAALFLASDLSRSCTGMTVFVDGGTTA